MKMSAKIAGVFFLVAIPVIALNHNKQGERHVSDRICDQVFTATQEECASQLENRWYDGGAVSYLREDHKKDIPICDRIATTALNTCNQVGKGIALPGPAPKEDSQ